MIDLKEVAGGKWSHEKSHDLPRAQKSHESWEKSQNLSEESPLSNRPEARVIAGPLHNIDREPRAHFTA